MPDEEVTLLERCVVCGGPVRKGPRVVNGLGDEGVACLVCLRRNRRRVLTYYKARGEDTETRA